MALTLKRDLQEWEERLVQYDQKTFQDVINFPNRLNAEMTNLMSTIGGLDPTITQGMKERASELLSEWEALKEQRFGELENMIDAFNEEYHKAHIPFMR